MNDLTLKYGIPKIGNFKNKNSSTELLPERVIDHQGKKIKISSDNGKETISIDGKRYLVVKDKEANTYSADLLPYDTYSSIEELAIALAEMEN